MKRLPDWHPRLINYLGKVAREPFEPGQMDCALFGAGCVLAMTGVDLSADFKGEYTTLKGGFKLLKKAGYADLTALAKAHFEEITVAFAQAGDVALIPAENELAFGLVQGEFIYVRNPDGLDLLPLRSASKVFRV